MDAHRNRPAIRALCAAPSAVTSTPVPMTGPDQTHHGAGMAEADMAQVDMRCAGSDQCAQQYIYPPRQPRSNYDRRRATVRSGKEQRKPPRRPRFKAQGGGVFC